MILDCNREVRLAKYALPVVGIGFIPVTLEIEEVLSIFSDQNDHLHYVSTPGP